MGLNPPAFTSFPPTLAPIATPQAPDVEADASLVRLAASPLFGIQAATLAALMRESASRSQSARDRLLGTPLGLGAGGGETVPLHSVATDPLQRRALQSLAFELRCVSTASLCAEKCRPGIES